MVLTDIKSSTLLSEYAGIHPELSFDVKCFSSPLDMLEEMDKTGAPDIALLDICMPGILGTEAAREILRKSEDSPDVIFLTTSPDYAVEAFSLHVGDYLVKPFSKERLLDTLDRVIEKRKRHLFIPVLYGKEVHRIDLYQVLYAEARNHSVEVHLKSGKCLKTHTTLTEMRQLFQQVSGFAAVGASYLVNLRCVQSILETTLEMTNADQIPVPRRLRGELKKQYFDFYTKEATGK